MTKTVTNNTMNCRFNQTTENKRPKARPNLLKIRRISGLAEVMRSCIAAALVLAVSVPVRAQEREIDMPGAVLGLSAGYDMLRPLIFPGGTNTSDFNSIGSAGFWGGLKLIFPKLFTEGFGLSTGISYGGYEFQASSTYEMQNLQSGGSTASSAANSSVAASYMGLQLDLFAYVQMGDIARLEFGPTGSVGILPSYVETVTLLEPGVTFDDLTRVRVYENSALNEGLATGGFSITTSFEIPMGRMALLPSIGITGSVAVLTNENDVWGVISGRGGLTLLFDGTNGRYDVPRYEEPTVEPPRNPTASIDIYSTKEGVRSDTLFIHTSQTLHRRSTHLYPVVHFQPGSDLLVDADARTSSASFSADSLSGSDIGVLYRRRLPALASQLAASPGDGIVITGSYTADEPAGLALRRAEMMRNYLHDFWNIDRSRIRLRTTGPSAERETGRSAIITSSALTRPLETEWIAEEVETPEIGLEPGISAPDGLYRWNVSVRIDGREIAYIDENTSDTDALVNVAGLLNSSRPSGHQPILEAELIVEDSLGAMAASRDRMVVRTSPPATAPEYTSQEYVLFSPTESDLKALAATITMQSASDVEYILLQPGNAVATSHADTLLQMLRSRYTSINRPIPDMTISRTLPETANLPVPVVVVETVSRTQPRDF